MLPSIITCGILSSIWLQGVHPSQADIGATNGQDCLFTDLLAFLCDWEVSMCKALHWLCVGCVPFGIEDYSNIIIRWAALSLPLQFSNLYALAL